MMNFDTVELENGITKVVLSGRMDIEGASAVDLKFSVLAGAKKNRRRSHRCEFYGFDGHPHAHAQRESGGEQGRKNGACQSPAKC